MSLVSLDALEKRFDVGGDRHVYAVNGVSLAIEPGETLAVIGESGSGKSTVGRLALGLLTPDAGTVRFEDQDIAALDRARMRELRARMSVVFQEPRESLNPRMRIEAAVREPLAIHRIGSREEQRERVLEALEHVGLSGGQVAERYPAALSGGQQQRVGIARAIVTRPRFVVLDEPTSSLDLSVRAQILNLLGELQRELGLAYLFISHDIATIAHVSDRVAVMYLGRVMELGPTDEVMTAPRHPYTRALLTATLSPDVDERQEHYPLHGEIPSPTKLPSGCPLYGRCPLQEGRCAQAPIALREVDGRQVACINV